MKSVCFPFPRGRVLLVVVVVVVVCDVVPASPRCHR
jgi:hypothetical protein